jgi:hypothetical protein
MLPKKLKEPKWLQKIHVPSWVVLILAIVFLLRIPSFFEPFYYGDEMIYLNLGNAMKRGMVLYRDIHDNKPPLLYLLASISGNVFWFRAILAGWMMATIAIFWKLAQALFPKNNWITKTATVTFAVLTTIPLLEGQIANAEVFMIGPTIAAFYILLTRKLIAKNLLLAGLLFSISTLFKVPAAFDIGTIVFLWVYTIHARKSGITGFFKNSVILAAGFLLPIIATLVWYAAKGAFQEYFIAAFLQNIGYLSSWRGSAVVEPFLVRNGPLLLRGGILLSGLSLLFIFKKRLTWQFAFIVAWVLFSLFAATLSERPYPHYLMQVVPAVSLLVGVLVAAQSLEQSLTLVPLFLIVLAAIRFQFWYYPTTSYYQHFVSFISGRTSHEEYLKSFDPMSPRNYAIAEFLASSSTKDDPIFVWGDSPAIYVLSNRLPPLKYVATYHIIDFSSQEEVFQKLEAKKPKFIIVLPDSPDFPILPALLQRNYILIEDIEGAKIWKVTRISLDKL